jgi:hypothetical protein
MAYQKRRSAILDKAQTRLRGLQSVNPTMDFGNGLGLQNYADLIETSAAQLQTYNLALAEVDRARIEFAETEASVSAISSRILSAVAAAYGRNSKEYEMAGGKAHSTYKRPKQQNSTTSASEAPPESNGSTSPASNKTAVDMPATMTFITKTNDS